MYLIQDEHSKKKWLLVSWCLVSMNEFVTCKQITEEKLNYRMDMSFHPEKR